MVISYRKGFLGEDEQYRAQLIFLVDHYISVMSAEIQEGDRYVYGLYAHQRELRVMIPKIKTPALRQIANQLLSETSLYIREGELALRVARYHLSTLQGIRKRLAG